MEKIINVDDAIKIGKQLKQKGNTIVLAGGCFDILHIGHIELLKNAKRKGGQLFVLLENDKNVKKLKGKGRPINSQKERAIILSSLGYVDYVVLLPDMTSNKDYDKLVYLLNPDIIAVTKDSPQIVHNLRQTEKINAKVLEVTKIIKDKSTTRLAKLIKQNF
ncbi:MAG: glycerol-3-phosphate cytidylyltransferase [Candidatus Levybacteria bacterium CG10_big_fil_rev_8_21_14_0_10_35_13]|nr:MAG: glycerol-3-phosphate cytidylyltransferase [Candidatus Levybacteria bacterium CG10_big_fil_rev_8_21_14_0_10_35_13]